MGFVFDATHYVPAGQERSLGKFDSKTRVQLIVLRGAYPELKDWGDLAISMAWGDYSKAVLLTSWSDKSLDVRDENFLNFLCWQQTRIPFGWGDATKELAKANEWRKG
ncbi:MAG: hypothetical protein ACR2P1_23825 [Pseudomonadales bacterium]